MFDDLEYLYDSPYFHKQKNVLFQVDDIDEEKTSVGEKDIWNIDSIVKKKSGNSKKGVIRFAEDIDDLKN